MQVKKVVDVYLVKLLLDWVILCFGMLFDEDVDDKVSFDYVFIYGLVKCGNVVNILVVFIVKFIICWQIIEFIDGDEFLSEVIEGLIIVVQFYLMLLVILFLIKERFFSNNGIRFKVVVVRFNNVFRELLLE